MLEINFLVSLLSRGDTVAKDFGKTHSMLMYPSFSKSSFDFISFEYPFFKIFAKSSSIHGYEHIRLGSWSVNFYTSEVNLETRNTSHGSKNAEACITEAVP